MCSKPPKPVAPPAPIPERESQIDGRRDRQQAAAASEQGGVQSTMLSSSSGGPAATVASPTLGG
jgi:hypothetical protein